MLVITLEDKYPLYSSSVELAPSTSSKRSSKNKPTPGVSMSQASCSDEDGYHYERKFKLKQGTNPLQNIKFELKRRSRKIGLVLFMLAAIGAAEELKEKSELENFCCVFQLLNEGSIYRLNSPIQ